MKTFEERLAMLDELIDEDTSDNVDARITEMLAAEDLELAERRFLVFLKWVRGNGNNDGPNDIDKCDYRDNAFEWSGETYLVLTDDEANEACKDSIRDSLWAFNAEFLESMTEVPADMFRNSQDKCEGANDGFLRVVEKTCGLDAFVDAAIAADGRGHFLNGYDGEERESDDFYIYES